MPGPKAPRDVMLGAGCAWSKGTTGCDDGVRVAPFPSNFDVVPTYQMWYETTFAFKHCEKREKRKKAKKKKKKKKKKQFIFCFPPAPRTSTSKSRFRDFDFGVSSPSFSPGYTHSYLQSMLACQLGRSPARSSPLRTRPEVRLNARERSSK